MKVIFMGTPDFAVPTLQTLIDSEHEILAVFTQPDRPKGRGNIIQMPPVKTLALSYDLTVYQPRRIKNQESIDILKALGPDLIVVAAFGQILSQEILDIPTYGCINVHGSLLPKYRGAAPIQWSIINGDPTSGITIQQMVYALDEGDILMKEELELSAKETGGSLHDKLSMLSGPLVIKTISAMLNHTLSPVKQNSEDATYAPMLSKATGLIHWADEAQKVEQLIRGLNPWPSAYTFYDGKMLKVWEAEVVKEAHDFKPGTIVIEDDTMTVACGKDKLMLKQIQLAGKKSMETSAFLRGHHIENGTILQ